jgi:flagellar basal body rod protein FlgG
MARRMQFLRAHMDPISVGAAGGLRARMEALDMLANNISNANTPGFKRDGEFYGLFESAEAVAWGSGTAALPVIEKHWTDYAQGTLNPTGAATHLALSGPGFFAVNGPSGPLYTRNGAFEVKPNGQVATQEGYPLRLAGGTPLQVQPGTFEIAPDGTVRQADAVIGRLDIVEFAPEALTKQGASLFRPVDSAAAPAPARATEVHQGKLEGSNVSSAESAVRLVSLLRQFEALQKAITLGGEMNRRAIEEVARVGQ